MRPQGYVRTPFYLRLLGFPEFRRWVYPVIDNCVGGYWAYASVRYGR